MQVQLGLHLLIFLQLEEVVEEEVLVIALVAVVGQTLILGAFWRRDVAG